jgi:hypothetical protein
MVFVRYERVFAGVLIGLSALRALIYRTGPIFEPPDERLHYTYTRYLVAKRALPVTDTRGEPIGDSVSVSP